MKIVASFKTGCFLFLFVGHLVGRRLLLGVEGFMGRLLYFRRVGSGSWMLDDEFKAKR